MYGIYRASKELYHLWVPQFSTVISFHWFCSQSDNLIKHNLCDWWLKKITNSTNKTLWKDSGVLYLKELLSMEHALENKSHLADTNLPQDTVFTTWASILYKFKMTKRASF